MSATVRIPTPLQRFTNNQAEVSAQGGTIAAVLQDLEQQFPGVRERLCDESGQLRRFVNVYVGDTDVRLAQGLQTDVPAGTAVSVIPAVAGG